MPGRSHSLTSVNAWGCTEVAYLCPMYVHHTILRLSAPPFWIIVLVDDLNSNICSRYLQDVVSKMGIPVDEHHYSGYLVKCHEGMCSC